MINIDKNDKFINNIIIFIIAVFTCIFHSLILIILLFFPKRAHHKSGTSNQLGKIDILITGRVDSRNWFYSHIIPINDNPSINSISMVVDGPVKILSKIILHNIPFVLQWLQPRAIIRSILTIIIAIREKPSIIMGYSFFPPGIFSLLAARFSGALSIVHLTGGPFELESGGLFTEVPFFPRFFKIVLRGLSNRIANQIDVIVVRGKKAQNYLNSNLITTKSIIIPGSVDVSKYQQLDYLNRCIDITFLGRIEAVKQPDHILYIVNKIINKRGPVNCIIAGDGTLKNNLHIQIQNMQLEKYIRISGHIEKVHRLLLRSKIFILTSRSEGLSIALAEAMMAGAVPIVYNVGDLGELVVNGITGHLISPGDIDSFADIVCCLLSDKARWKHLSKSAREAAYNHNSVQSVIQKWETCFNEVLQ